MQPTPTAARVLVVVVSAVLVCRGRCSLHPARLMRGSLGRATVKSSEGGTSAEKASWRRVIR